MENHYGYLFLNMAAILFELFCLVPASGFLKQQIFRKKNQNQITTKVMNEELWINESNKGNQKK